MTRPIVAFLACAALGIALDLVGAGFLLGAALALAVHRDPPVRPPGTQR